MKIKLLGICLLFSTLSFGQFGEAQSDFNSNHLMSEYVIANCDIDNDGDIDLVWRNSISHSINYIYVNLNKGNNTFTSPILIDTINLVPYQGTLRIDKISSADFDNDGDNDLIIGYQYTGTPGVKHLTLLENIGNGYSFKKKIINSPLAYEFDVSDFDNDGFIDILFQTFYQTNSDSLYILKNNGNLNFTLIPIAKNSPLSLSPSAIRIRDFNNDGLLDFFTTGRSGNLGAIFYFENNGSFVFTPTTVKQYSGVPRFGLTDINSDGKTDLIYQYSNNVIITHNLPGNSFYHFDTLIRKGNSNESLLFFDYSNDGRSDMIHCSFDTIYFYKNNLLGSLVFDTVYTRTTNSNSFWSNPKYAISDYDLDGDIDLVISNSYQLGWGESKIVYFENKNGRYLNYRCFTPEANSTSLYLLDIDNDGLKDQVYTDYDLNKISYLKNLGNNQFSCENIIRSFESPVVMSYVNINKDGKVDLFCQNTNSSKKLLLINTGNGNFKDSSNSMVFFPVVGSMYTYLRDDIDNDGDLDVFMGAGIYLDGNGGANLPNGYTGTPTALVDFDNDNDLDFVTYNTSSLPHNFYLIENTGNGTFNGIKTKVANGRYAESFYVRDFDNDGFKDFILNNDTIVVLQNDSGKGFKRFFTYHLPCNKIFSNFIDIDSDGYADIISLVDDTVMYAMYSLNGSSFLPPITLSKLKHLINPMSNFFYTKNRILVDDLNNDGSEDVLLTYFQNLYGPTTWLPQSGSIRLNNLSTGRNLFTGKVFIDDNNNKICDSTEVGIEKVTVNVSSPSNSTKTQNDGRYAISTDTLSNKKITAIIPKYWKLTTDSSSYNRKISKNTPYIDSLDFGIAPDTSFDNLTVKINSSFSRCFTNGKIWVDIQNIGTTKPNTIIKLDIDTAITFVSSIPMADSVNANSIYFHYDSLNYFTSKKIDVDITYPGLASINDTLRNKVTLYNKLNNGVLNIDSNSSVLVCAYDPNFKEVSPLGFGKDNTIPKNQKLDYTIHFQNTGNDTAITVVITDVIHPKLDISTFQFISSSHPVTTKIGNDREAVFTFKNIYLPDSGANFVESMGYFSYSIFPDSSVNPGTEIANKAKIYFDYNPAIITNTTVNTIECYHIPNPTLTYNNYFLKVGSTGGFLVNWYRNDTLLKSSYSDTLYPFINGNYYVVLSDSSFCSKISGDYAVTVCSYLPNPILSYNNQFLKVDSTGSFLVNWYRNNILVKSDYSDTLMPQTNGNYHVTLSDSSFCLKKSNNYNVINLGLEPYNADMDFTVFPNPSNIDITIFLNSTTKTENTILIIDLLGRIMYSVNEKQQKKITITKNKLAEGINIVSLIDENGQVLSSKKVIIIK